MRKHKSKQHRDDRNHYAQFEDEEEWKKKRKERERHQEEEQEEEEEDFDTFKNESLPLVYKLVNVGVTDPCA